MNYNLLLLLASFIIPISFVQESSLSERIFGVVYSRYCLKPYGEHNTVLLCIDNHPLWFVTAMIVTTVIFYYILPNFVSKKKYVWLILLLVVSYLLTKVPVLLPWSIDTAFALCMFMLVGYEMKGKIPDNKPIKNNIIIFWGLLVLYYCMVKINGASNIAVRIYGGRNGLYNVILFFLIGVLGSFLCIWVCSQIKESGIGQVFELIGKSTWSIMGLHVFLFHIAMQIYEPDIEKSILLYKMYMIVINVLIIGLCVGFNYLIQIKRSVITK